jgi:hypothetical protein
MLEGVVEDVEYVMHFRYSMARWMLIEILQGMPKKRNMGLRLRSPRHGTGYTLGAGTIGR